MSGLNCKDGFSAFDEIEKIGLPTAYSTTTGHLCFVEVTTSPSRGLKREIEILQSTVKVLYEQ